MFVVDCSISEPCFDLPRRSLRRADLYKSFVFAVLFIIFKENTLIFFCGPDSSVGIATDYGLDGPGSNPGGDDIFRPSRPALGPTQAPVQWVPGLSQG